MAEDSRPTIPRRNVLGVAIAGVAAATAGTVVAKRVTAERDDQTDKLKARFQGDSTEVRNFYRVNSYPKS